MTRDETSPTPEPEMLDTTKVAERWRMTIVEGLREALDEMDEDWDVGDKLLFEPREDGIYLELVELGTTEIADGGRISLIKDVRERFAEEGQEVEEGDRMVFERVGDDIRIRPA